MTWNPRIEKLQRTLNARLQPSPNLKTDGEWGPRTQAAWNAYSRIKQQAAASAAMATAAAAPADGLLHDERAELWMSIARGELNVVEVPGASGSNPTIHEYLNMTNKAGADDDTAWCSAFANWVMRKAGFLTAGIAVASSWRNFGYECDARYGAVTVLLANGKQLDQWGAGAHVGFLDDLTPTYYRLLGGNQGPNGAVNVRGFARSSFTVLGGFRWPVRLTDDPAALKSARPSGLIA